MMHAKRYPEKNQHLEQHQIFLNDVAIMKQQFLTKGASTSLLIQLNTALMQWIIDHIKKVDIYVRYSSNLAVSTATL